MSSHISYWVVESDGNPENEPPLFLSEGPANRYAKELTDNGYLDVRVVPLSRVTSTQEASAGMKGSVNCFGVDVRYFREKLDQLLRDMEGFTSTELARYLGRLAITADSETMRESEFNIGAISDEPKYIESNDTELAPTQHQVNAVLHAMSFVRDRLDNLGPNDIGEADFLDDELKTLGQVIEMIKRAGNTSSGML